MSAAGLLDTIVSDVLATNPDAVEVFLARGMACPGCPFARFESVTEVACIYGADPLELAAALAAANAFIAIQEN